MFAYLMMAMGIAISADAIVRLTNTHAELTFWKLARHAATFRGLTMHARSMLVATVMHRSQRGPAVSHTNWASERPGCRFNIYRDAVLYIYIHI